MRHHGQELLLYSHAFLQVFNQPKPAQQQETALVQQWHILAFPISVSQGCTLPKRISVQQCILWQQLVTAGNTTRVVAESRIVWSHLFACSAVSLACALRWCMDMKLLYIKEDDTRACISQELSTCCVSHLFANKPWVEHVKVAACAEELLTQHANSNVLTAICVMTSSNTGQTAR